MRRTCGLLTCMFVLLMICLVDAQEEDTPVQSQVNDLLANLGSGNVDAPPNTEVPIPDGGPTVELSGPTDIVDGELSSVTEMSWPERDSGTEVSIKGGTNIDFTDNGYTIESAQTLQIGDLFMTNAQGVVKTGDTFTVTFAESFLKNGVTTTNANDLTVQPTSFQVKQADSVFSSCIKATNVIDSTVTIFQDAVEIQPEDGVAIQLSDCVYSNAVFESNGGKVTLNKQVPTTYNIRHRLPTVEFNNFKNRISSDTTSASL